MSLSQLKFHPRLLDIKGGNTRVAEGLHHMQETFRTFQAQAKEARGKVPLEPVPQKELIGQLCEKVSQCESTCRNLRDHVQKCSLSVHEGLRSLTNRLGELSKMLSQMQSTTVELRSFSFDPVTQISSHIASASARLEKHALAENDRWFLPWVLPFLSSFFVGWWMVFNPSHFAMFVFGDHSDMHNMVMDLLGFGLVAGGCALISAQFYRSFKPSSKGYTDPNPDLGFWLEGSLFAYIAFAGLAVIIWSYSLAVWISGTPNNDWQPLIVVGGILVMAIGAILSIINICVR